MKIIFFGTPEFATFSLDAIIKAGHEVAAVVTMPDKPGNRGHSMIESPVKLYAKSHGIPVLQPTNLKDEAFVGKLRAIDAPLFVVIAFRMLPEVVWNMPELGTFNLHASLLPSYRGAAPINRAIMNGEKLTGVTTFFLKYEIDTGDIIEQRKVEIEESDNAGTLHDKLMAVGAEMVVDTLNHIENGSIVTQPQPEGIYIPAPKIFKDDCRINWQKPAIEIHNHVRGLSPYPAAWSNLRLADGRILTVKIYSTKLTDATESDFQPGSINTISGKMTAVCGDGRSLEIEELMPGGKKRMSGKAFLAGYKPDKFI